MAQRFGVNRKYGTNNPQAIRRIDDWNRGSHKERKEGYDESAQVIREALGEMKMEDLFDHVIRKEKEKQEARDAKKAKTAKDKKALAGADTKKVAKKAAWLYTLNPGDPVSSWKPPRLFLFARQSCRGFSTSATKKIKKAFDECKQNLYKKYMA